MTHFSIDYRHFIDWMSVDTVLLDEILPDEDGGCLHEIAPPTRRSPSAARIYKPCVGGTCPPPERPPATSSSDMGRCRSTKSVALGFGPLYGEVNFARRLAAAVG